MQIDTIKRTVLIADYGKYVTDGEFYAKTIILADGRDPSEFYEITNVEYDAIENELFNDARRVENNLR